MSAKILVAAINGAVSVPPTASVLIADGSDRGADGFEPGRDALEHGGGLVDRTDDDVSAAGFDVFCEGTWHQVSP
jgi:hypothetical protein